MGEEPIADSVMRGMEPSDGCLLQVVLSVLSYHEQLLGAKFTKEDKADTYSGNLSTEMRQTRLFRGRQ